MLRWVTWERVRQGLAEGEFGSHNMHFSRVQTNNAGAHTVQYPEARVQDHMTVTPHIYIGYRDMLLTMTSGLKLDTIPIVGP